jgi:DNA-binding transcriptional ArsR family regulator
LVKLAGGPPNDPSDSFHASISPEMQAYRDKMEACQTTLPDDSVLTREEYLAMAQAIEDMTRRQALQALVSDGDLSAVNLEATLDLGADDACDHLSKLVGVGLVQLRQRKEPDRPGVDSYYRATTLGKGILEHGVAELMRREHEFLEAYS